MIKINLMAKKDGAEYGYHLGVLAAGSVCINGTLVISDISKNSLARINRALRDGFAVTGRNGEAINI